MKTSTRVMICFTLLAAATPVSAEDPPPQVIMRRMHDVLWPDRESTRDLTFTVSAQQDATKLTAKEARRKVGGYRRMLIVLQSPPGLDGMAWLVQPGPEQTAQWLFEPTLQRVRKILPVQGFEAFLATEYSYADLGLVDLDMTHTLLAVEDRDGQRSYKVQSVPRNPWYYSRTVTWVAADSHAPLAREYYDTGGALWKVERFGPVQEVGGVPTLLQRTIEDKQAGGRTTIDASAVRYDVSLPDELFDPLQLPAAAASPAWK